MPSQVTKSVPTQENPEWTKDRLEKAKRFSDLSQELQTALAPKRRRGPQKLPVKEKVSIRLSYDVVQALRSKGRGWQRIADETLRKYLIED